jgi:hypothetical protein
MTAPIKERFNNILNLLVKQEKDINYASTVAPK